MRVLPGRNAAPDMDEQGAARVAQDETQDQIKDNHQSTRPVFSGKVTRAPFISRGCRLSLTTPTWTG